LAADVFNVGLFVPPLLFAAQCAFLAFFVLAVVLVLCRQQGELVTGIEISTLSRVKLTGADNQIIVGFNG